jgi:hypothetical protein
MESLHIYLYRRKSKLIKEFITIIITEVVSRRQTTIQVIFLYVV